MPGRTIAIGDIHGCARALGTLFELIQPESDDTLIPLGDVIDRGPDSKSVVEQLLNVREKCHLRPVLGNHEEMFLGVLRRNSPPHSWLQFGGVATLDSYGFNGDLSVIPLEHIDFIESFADAVEMPNYFFVHANYDPQLPIDEQLASKLRWTSLENYIPAPHISGRVAILGHTPDRSGEIFSLRHLKCIDTYCHGGRWLTALDVESGRVWQANDRGEVRRN